jgi:hypothetical protein
VGEYRLAYDMQRRIKMTRNKTAIRERHHKTTAICTTTTIRIPVDARARLQAAADAQRRSLSNFLIVSALAFADQLVPQKEEG